MTEPIAPVFATTFLYSACKVVGMHAWPEYLRSQLARPQESDWPSIRTLAYELANVCNAELVTDATTYIDRARCVAAGRFLASDKDVWLTCDDDNGADEDELRKLILACRATRRGIAIPYMNRDGKSMTFRAVRGPTEWLSVAGGRTVPVRFVDRVGFGLVALHRDLVEQLAQDAVWFRERETSPLECPHLFVNDVEEGLWTGEDFAFSRRCERAGMPLRVLLEAPCEHAGILAMLDVEGNIRVADVAHAEALDQALRERERALAGQPLETG
jgi:hypothetical protein